eukprot:scaffold93294_cov27-Tisochrysis_lutea.AAC.5
MRGASRGARSGCDGGGEEGEGGAGDGEGGGAAGGRGGEGEGGGRGEGGEGGGGGGGCAHQGNCDRASSGQLSPSLPSQAALDQVSAVLGMTVDARNPRTLSASCTSLSEQSDCTTKHHGSMHEPSSSP